ncbi:MAG: imidazole glycerol phosphate synthase subunit HisH [Lentisphaerae bacterium]|jgi:imidazole glycerol-phosphate synthase subunit HisH|nr:imidazole glycerol phosphate synthase subunit HisH [Lentisphaerota bacterium]MBT4818184.1 imidazole glycerol phosphate synthase subunit HisH [Lentisphaerota bacterium]MBT5610365.1 imidazole glycerol phosphate synthase subunit HisH [Lentisphaerota bacterium]MBT7056193.1 imidazole glycerol phosphate synthase subunit HisH [Lentisphaerota bacterium]MBT7841885.1 imidazole glycerol phosphate synthase subunit HisH [Lentisphaerota bacterium]
MIAIVDYRAGNLTSVRLAFEALNVPCTVTSSAADVLAAERVVFPGVGAAGAAMRALRSLGLEDTIRQVVAAGTPFLGICLGTQIILEESEEDDGTACIGVLPGRVPRFRPVDRYDKIPQIGWNAVTSRRPHPLLDGIEQDSEFYFVHSYYPAPSRPEHIIGETTYADATFASIIGTNNLFATQFHPERSGRIGLKLLENFTRWDGKC